MAEHDELDRILQHHGHQPFPTGANPALGHVAIVLRDSVNRRLLEACALQLELVPTLLEAGPITLAELFRYELVITEEDLAGMLREVLSTVEDGEARMFPALLAVRPGARTEELIPPAATPFEGILTLSEQPAMVTAQLGVLVYAHRAYVRRYQDAIDELHLNRRIFRSVTSGISVARADGDLELVYVNPAFEAITGYSIEEAMGRNCRFLQAGHSEQPGLVLLREALKQGREAKAIVRNYRKDGTAFWNELAISPIRNHNGRITHFVGIQQDVTSRVEFEEALRESEKLATAGRLAASIAHEINNPLEAITNLIYLARHAQDLGEAERHLNLADAELRRVALLTSQSLRFYKQSTAPTAARASDLVDSVLDVYAQRLLSLHIEVLKRERTCDSIVCFESELRQVISNLVRNAIDAMKPAGTGRLCVRTRGATSWRTDAKGVLITIADNGSGMSEETMARLYDAFFTTKGHSGTGLGLWVSREIINRHSGVMRVRSCSTPGRSWTVFQLFLPYQGLVP